MPIRIDSGLCLSLSQSFSLMTGEFGLLIKEGGHGVFLCTIHTGLAGTVTKMRLLKQMDWIILSATGLAGRTASLLLNAKASSGLTRERMKQFLRWVVFPSERLLDNEIDLIIDDSGYPLVNYFDRMN